MTKKTTNKCTLKHISDLDNWEIDNFSYKYIGGEMLIIPTSIWRSLRKVGLSEIANRFLESVLEGMDRKIKKKKEGEKDE